MDPAECFAGMGFDTSTRARRTVGKFRKLLEPGVTDFPPSITIYYLPVRDVRSGREISGLLRHRETSPAQKQPQPSPAPRPRRINELEPMLPLTACHVLEQSGLHQFDHGQTFMVSTVPHPLRDLSRN